MDEGFSRAVPHVTPVLAALFGVIGVLVCISLSTFLALRFCRRRGGGAGAGSGLASARGGESKTPLQGSCTPGHDEGSSPDVVPLRPGASPNAVVKTYKFPQCNTIHGTVPRRRSAAMTSVSFDDVITAHPPPSVLQPTVKGQSCTSERHPVRCAIGFAGASRLRCSRECRDEDLADGLALVAFENVADATVDCEKKICSRSGSLVFGGKVFHYGSLAIDRVAGALTLRISSTSEIP
ncbi:unnamed protein product [Darwinula stevensoni]|uniref:Uncharacterized protein n=1 Tax=Darwinula stevensoni TaxID=69355 RepID=A0A7R8XIK7_9CRUS|nr:unnamed protein product [Darwinula stevensoni]CAG0894402.1 unnamed protein product [Darwinula stevensoni]